MNYATLSEGSMQTSWPALRNPCWANQIRDRNAVHLKMRLVGEGDLGSSTSSFRGQGSILRHDGLPPCVLGLL